MITHDLSQLKGHLDESNERIELRREVKRVSRENTGACLVIGVLALATFSLSVSNFLAIEALEAQQAEAVPPVEVHLNERAK